VAADAPTMTLTHTFVGDPTTYANRAYTVQELSQLTGLQTDGDGTVTFQAPVTLDTATIVFDSGNTFTLSIGGMDPINTISGIFKRLQNLGYFDVDVQLDTTDPLNNIGLLRPALLALKAAQGGGDAAPSSSHPSTPPSNPPSKPPSDPPPSGAPASSGAGSSVECSTCWNDLPPGAPDKSGLGDDGTLDAETTTLLKNAYAC
jgi:hypothetical protein